MVDIGLHGEYIHYVIQKRSLTRQARAQVLNRRLPDRLFPVI